MRLALPSARPVLPWLLTLVAGLSTAACGHSEARVDLVGGFAVEVLLDGAPVAGLVSASGPSASIEVTEYVSGDDPVTRKRPGRVKYGDITLKRGYVGGEGSDPLFAWFQEVASGKDVRKSITIILRAADGTEASRYVLRDCFPVRWSAPEELPTNAFGVEVITFAVERMELGSS